MAVLKQEAGSELGNARVLQVGDREAAQEVKMVVHAHGQLNPLGDGEVTVPAVSEIIRKEIEHLRKDKGSLCFGVTTGLSGILANFIFRQSFKVKYEAFKTYASLTTLPFLSTIVTYNLFVTDALHSGSISQENYILRNSLVAIGCGVLYPSALAFCQNGRLAVKYHTVPLPPKGRVIFPLVASLSDWDENNDNSSALPYNICSITWCVPLHKI